MKELLKSESAIALYASAVIMLILFVAQAGA